MLAYILHGASLGEEFWAEAGNTAVYLINRLPTKALDNGMTPYEAWYGKKPTFNHLRIFGCKAYVHVPKQKRKRFESKTLPCIFLGYDANTTKIWRVYDPQSR